MYIPDKMSIDNPTETQRFIQDYPFAAMITYTDRHHVSHLPFIIKTGPDQQRYLSAHMAKANPHWQHIEANESLVIFSGPHAYISPRWYARKPAVPTWNYITVHVYGKAVIQDQAQTRSLLDDMLNMFEPDLTQSENETLSEEYIQQLLNGIVGFSLKIDSVEGKFKLGQHKPSDDQAGVIRGLQQSNSADAQSLYKFMQSWGYIAKKTV